MAILVLVRLLHLECCSILNNKMFYSFSMLSNIFPVCYVTDQKRLHNVFYITYAV